MIRRFRLLSLLAASLLVAGCPGDWLIAEDGDNSNIISSSRGGSGGATFTGGTSTGGSTDGGSTPGFSCTGLRAGVGVESDAPTGSNPTSVSLADPVQVLPLYFGNGNVSLSVSNAKTAVVAVSSLQESGQASMQAAWSGSGVGTAYRTQAELLAGELPQNRAERLVREHARTLRAEPVSAAYRPQAGVTYATGASRTFKILNFSGGAPHSVGTKAVYVYDAPSGQKGSFVIWVDNEDQAIFQGSDKLQTVATELRDRIYKNDTCAFGADTTIAENDALPVSKRIYLTDDYVHFVFSRRVDNGTLTTGDGTLGFFTLADLADSGYNKGKVLYIASSATSRSMADMYAVIAHEFQHLLFSCHRVKAVGLQNHIFEFQSGANTWLNEGLSMLAMMLNGYGPDGAQPSPSIVQQVADYLMEPSKYSMTGFYQDTGNPTDAYGMVTLFAQYLNDRLGDAALKDFHSIDNSATMYNGLSAGVTNVDPTDLADRVMTKYGTSLGRMFADFGAAVMLDGSAALSGLSEPLASRYQIGNVNLRGKYTGLEPTPIQMQGPGVQVQSTANLALRPYTVNYLFQKNLSGTISLGFTNVSAGGYGAKLILTM